MLEELLAAKELVIGILDPARAQILVGEIMHVLEDREPRHQPRRQRRMAGLVGIDRAEPLLEKAPVDRAAELRQRVVHVDDLVEPRLEEIILPAVPPLLGPHRITLRQADGETESRSNDPINCKKSSRQTLLSRKRNDLPIRVNASKIRRVQILHGQLAMKVTRSIPAGSALLCSRQVVVPCALVTRRRTAALKLAFPSRPPPRGK